VRLCEILWILYVLGWRILDKVWVRDSRLCGERNVREGLSRKAVTAVMSKMVSCVVSSGADSEG
jgi:hypothetical protein